jgi:hypothetical protein
VQLLVLGYEILDAYFFCPLGAAGSGAEKWQPAVAAVSQLAVGAASTAVTVPENGDQRVEQRSP